MCQEEQANLFFPEALDELHWIKGMISSTDKLYIGFKGYDKQKKVHINMDNSEGVGIRGVTSE